MSKKAQLIKKIAGMGLACIILLLTPVSAYATTTDDLQNEVDDLNDQIKDLDNQKKDAQKAKESAQSELNGVKGQISSISGAMGDLGDQIEGINEELVGLLTDIDLIEADIETKKQEIADTEVEYDEAVETQNEQYESMKIRIKYMYEQGDATYLSIFLDAATTSLSDALNKADYVEQLYSYDRKMLEEYKAAVEHTKEVWNQLEEEKSELETSKEELEEEQDYLEELEGQLQGEYDNYNVMLSQAKQQAAVYTAKINQQTAEIKQLEKEKQEKQKEADKKSQEIADAKKAEEAAAAADDSDDEAETSTKSSSSSSSSGSSAKVSGSGTGSQIASYALQFVGNPYVAGGTSLTNGADCSGFVQSVYKAFGYNLPRTSYSQATVGTSVSYSDAQPGDIIYYGGHVAIYIGNGQIVHASTERTGIKVASATYRSIVTIRRVVN